MQARYYDPNIGRFLSVDPVGFLDTGEPGMFNRYGYTWNDPVNLVDPDGEYAKSSDHHEDHVPLNEIVKVELHGDSLTHGQGHLEVVVTGAKVGSGRADAGTESFTAQGGPYPQISSFDAITGRHDSKASGKVDDGYPNDTEEVIDRATGLGSFDEVRSNVESFKDSFNSVKSDYSATKGPNSNTFGKGAFTAATGRRPNMRNKKMHYSGYKTAHPTVDAQKVN